MPPFAVSRSVAGNAWPTESMTCAIWSNGTKLLMPARASCAELKGRCHADGVAVLAGHLHEATDGVTNEAQQVTQRDGTGVERLLGRAAEHLHQRGGCHGGGASHLGLASALGARRRRRSW